MFPVLRGLESGQNVRGDGHTQTQHLQRVSCQMHVFCLYATRSGELGGRWEGDGREMGEGGRGGERGERGGERDEVRDEMS